MLGAVPNTEWLRGCLALDENGFVRCGAGFEAAGGKAAMQKVTSRHVWGTFEVPAQGMGGPIEILTTNPMKMLTKIEIPGMGSTATGLNGETGWMMNPAMGPMLIDGTAQVEIGF